MHTNPLRTHLARESALLLLRGRVKDFNTARKQAARRFSQRRISSDDLPANAEIEHHLRFLGGLADDEFQLQQSSITLLTLQSLQRESPNDLWVDARSLPVTAQNIPDLELIAVGQVSDLEERLLDAEIPLAREHNSLLVKLARQCRIQCVGELSAFDHGPLANFEPVQLVIESLKYVIESGSLGGTVSEENGREYLLLLLPRLADIQLHPNSHPEGDLLYHSLQVFELGKERHPYDEEFLWACLLHDVGYVIDRHDPVGAILHRLHGDEWGERTRFFIECLADAHEYLKTGVAPKPLRKHEDFDLLVDFAKCDRDGRMPGAEVPELEAAVEYLDQLDSLWDES